MATTLDHGGRRACPLAGVLTGLIGVVGLVQRMAR